MRLLALAWLLFASTLHAQALGGGALAGEAPGPRQGIKSVSGSTAGGDAPAPAPDPPSSSDDFVAWGRALSALPAVLAWVPPYETPDDDGNRVRMPGGWREYRVADLPRDQWRWKADPPDVDERTPELGKWSLRRSPPPFRDAEDAGAVDAREPAGGRDGER